MYDIPHLSLSLCRQMSALERPSICERVPCALKCRSMALLQSLDSGQQMCDADADAGQKVLLIIAR